MESEVPKTTGSLKLAPYLPDVSLSPSSLAIVGNSSKLLKQEHGAQIDGYTDVVRFNLARLKGFSHQAGSKTTHRFYGGILQTPEGAANVARTIDASDTSQIITRPHNKNFAESAFPGKNVVYFKLWDKVARNAYITLSRYTGKKHDVERQPRSGIVLLAALLDSSDGQLRPDLYGFDTSADGDPNWKVHYFDARPKPDFSKNMEIFHAPLELEWDTLLTLDAKGFIRLF